MNSKAKISAAASSAVLLAANWAFGAATTYPFVAAAPTIAYTAGSVSGSSAATGLGTPAPTVTPTVTDAASNSTLPEGVTYANFGPLITSAYNANTGGVINFEQVDENGAFDNHTTTGNTPTPTYSWPSQGNSTANGLTFGNIPNLAAIETAGNSNTAAPTPRAVQVNYGVSQPTSTTAYNGTAGDPGGVTATNTLQLVGGTNSISLWRDAYDGATGVPIGSTRNVALGFTPTGSATSGNSQANTADGFDSNNGENNSGNLGASPTSGNGYAGITNDGTPVILDFSSNPLAAFGIDAIGRNSTRPLLIHLTLVDGTVITSSTEANAGAGTGAIFYGFDLTSSDLAAHGGIIYATLDVTSNNTDRYDDLSFIVASTPEPSSLCILGLASLGLLRRGKRNAIPLV